jgi:hypothetical protein
VGALPGVLFWASHVNEWLAQVGEDVFLERSNLSVVALYDGVCRGARSGEILGKGESLRHPGVTATIEQTDIFVPEEGENPECVGGPPVALVAVEDHGVISRDALFRHQLGKGFSLKVIANNGVIEFGVPIDFDGAGNVTGVIEEDILVGFQDD